MRTGKDFPMSAVDTGMLIAAAYPKHAAKHLEKGLGCTPRQAWRIVSSGHAPAHFAAALLRLVDQAISRNLQELESLHGDLRRIHHAALLDTGADRYAASVGPVPPHDPGLSDRPAQTAVARPTGLRRAGEP